jgi:type VI secretion system protein
MPTGHSLLTRIREQIGQTGRATEQQVRDSILENLRAMCQTRVGSMLSCPDFGIVSVSELMRTSEGASILADSIRNTVKAHEPRLRNVRVQHVPSEDMTLHFKINAQMVVDGRSSRPGPNVLFDTTVDPSHLISVQ